MRRLGGRTHERSVRSSQVSHGVHSELSAAPPACCAAGMCWRNARKRASQRASGAPNVAANLRARLTLAWELSGCARSDFFPLVPWALHAGAFSFWSRFFFRPLPP